MKKKWLLFVCMVLLMPLLLLPSAKGEPVFPQSVLDALHAVPVENGYQVDRTMDLFDISYILRITAGYEVRETHLSFLISGGPWGPEVAWLDKQSRFLSRPEYEEFKDSFTTDPTGPIFAKKDGTYGYLRRYDGGIVIPFQFTGCCAQSEFCDGYALGDNIVWYEDGTGHKHVHVLLRADGYIVPFPEGIMPVSYPMNGLVLITPVYDENGRPEDVEYSLGIGNVEGQVLLPPVPCGFESGLEKHFVPHSYVMEP